MRVAGDTLRIVLWILGIWTAVSLVACVPLVLLFRAQARRNLLRSREDRRSAWAVAAEGKKTADR
jgi:hypothetical protein